MKRIEKIIVKGKLLAIIIRQSFKIRGVEFFTEKSCSQQLAYMNQPKGYCIKPHIHNAVKREIVFTRETLFIKSGRIRADFYNKDKKYSQSRILKKGDTLLLIEGGHGFEFIESSEIIEVKQGPYFEKLDSIKFEPVIRNRVKVKE